MKLVQIVIVCLLVATPCTARGVMAEDSSALAFPDSLFRVDSIVITGNEDTRDFVILREMTLKNDSLITRQGVEYNKNRIYSLGLFNRVEIEVQPTSGTTATLAVSVHERWFIYPYPVFGLKDRDWDKAYYGLGMVHINFRGRNEKLYASFALGYDPWVSLGYRNTFLEETGTDFLDARLAYNNVKNKSVQLQQLAGDFEEKHFSFGVTIGSRLGTKHTIWFNPAYRSAEIPRTPVSSTSFVGGTDRFVQLSAGYMYDTRDLQEYPVYGTLAAFSVTRFGLFSNSIDFFHYNADYRRYIPITSSVTLTARVFSVFTSGLNPPSYEHVYLGYSDRIRGHFREVMEGENVAGFSTELHYVLLAPEYIKVDFLPKEFSLWRFAIAAAAFADAGTTWFRYEKVDMFHMPAGYGVGLHFLLPFSIVLRTEYAWSELGKGEFMAVVGSSF